MSGDLFEAAQRSICDAEQRGAPADRSELATSGADLVLAELEAALEMRLVGADAKALGRVVRRIEELLDE